MADDETTQDCKDLNAKSGDGDDSTVDIGDDFMACLPFGASLTLTNGKLSYKAPTAPTVSEGYVVTSGGCITDVKAAELPVYTGEACAPVPNACSDGGGDGVGGSVSISGVSPISVSGSGTSTNPYIISYSGGGGGGSTNIVAGNSGVVVGHSGSTTTVSHKAGTLNAGAIGSLQIDAFGHIVGGSSGGGSGGLLGVVGGTGIDVTTENGIATVSLLGGGGGDDDDDDTCNCTIRAGTGISVTPLTGGTGYTITNTAPGSSTPATSGGGVYAFTIVSEGDMVKRNTLYGTRGNDSLHLAFTVPSGGSAVLYEVEAAVAAEDTKGTCVDIREYSSDTGTSIRSTLTLPYRGPNGLWASIPGSKLSAGTHYVGLYFRFPDDSTTADINTAYRGALILKVYILGN